MNYMIFPGSWRLYRETNVLPLRETILFVFIPIAVIS